MGAALLKRSKTIYYDDDDNHHDGGLSPNMFQDLERAALKSFCNQHDIHQNELNLLFRKHVTYDEAVVHSFRVRISDLRKPYLNKSLLTVVRRLCFYLLTTTILSTL